MAHSDRASRRARRGPPLLAGATAALAVLAAGAACAVAACDAIIGLNQFSTAPCSDCNGPDAVGGDALSEGDGTADSGDGGRDGTIDGHRDAQGGAVPVAEAGDAPGGLVDAGLDIAAPTASQIWVHWPMPNPDAMVAPGSDVSLPNPMSYSQGSGPYVLDTVTNLSWELGVGAPAQDYEGAAIHCAGLAPPGQTAGWRVPTRIELVSLIDFTRVPTLDTEAFAFDGGGGVYWTSSTLPSDGGPDASPTQWWVVDFGTGGVSPGSAAWVRCVNGPPPGSGGSP